MRTGAISCEISPIVFVITAGISSSLFDGFEEIGLDFRGTSIRFDGTSNNRSRNYPWMHCQV